MMSKRTVEDKVREVTKSCQPQKKDLAFALREMGSH